MHFFRAVFFNVFVATARSMTCARFACPLRQRVAVPPSLDWSQGAPRWTAVTHGDPPPSIQPHEVASVQATLEQVAAQAPCEQWLRQGAVEPLAVRAQYEQTAVLAQAAVPVPVAVLVPVAFQEMVAVV
jgi:hypothetical protein